jgi:transposase
MLYLGIDQHRKQWTVNLRDELGEVIMQRQVSTEPARAEAFVSELASQAAESGGCVAIVEVCGFNDWLLALLERHQLGVLLVQPESRSRRKTDRRDASQLSETLWVNRQRLLAGKPVRGVRVIVRPTPEEAAARQLTGLRRQLGQSRTRTFNRIQRLLLQHNLHHACPTKTMWTKKCQHWLEQLALPAGDRLSLDVLLAQWKLWDEQLAQVEQQIEQSCAENPAVATIRTMPGAGPFSSLTLASRIGDVRRFKRPKSLANYFGLAPSSHNSGDQNRRLGSITKEGSTLARHVLGEMVLHALRRDGVLKRWYLNIKRRRGAKIARVAVMRRLTTILWHMLTKQQPYEACRPQTRLPAGAS